MINKKKYEDALRSNLSRRKVCSNNNKSMRSSQMVLSTQKNKKV